MNSTTRTTDSNGYFIESPIISPAIPGKPTRNSNKRLKAIRDAYKRRQVERNKLRAINTLMGEIRPVWSMQERRAWATLLPYDVPNKGELSAREQQAICTTPIPAMVSVKDANLFLNHRRIALPMETTILERSPLSSLFTSNEDEDETDYRQPQIDTYGYDCGR